jgi:hypothetical protein
LEKTAYIYQNFKKPTMKKITLFAFAMAALSLASCKKDRTCTCTSNTTSTTVNSGSNSTSYSYSTSNSDADAFVIVKEKKSIARPNCLSKKVTDTNKYAEGTSAELTTTTVIDETCSLK